jgi:serine/threonine protein phosphatase PrpC
MSSANDRNCPGCGALAVAGDNFCESCGSELAPAQVSSGAIGDGCPACQSDAVSADGYCEQCGRQLPAARDHAEIDLGLLAGISDRGRQHHRNEDAMALAVTQTPSGPAAVAVVCDGVSTAARPDEASLAAATTAIRILTEALRVGDSAPTALRAAIGAADAVVTEMGEMSVNPPATTFAAAVVTSEEVTVCWIGDTRAYWLPAGPGGSALLITRDDTVASDLVAAGALSEADAMNSPHAHVITGWLGADAGQAEPHSASFRPDRAGIVLLCSDGLWNYEPDADGLARLALPRGLADLPGAAADLLAFALEAGGHDNITVVLAAFRQEKSTPDEGR